jgi:hypothetical protein
MQRRIALTVVGALAVAVLAGSAGAAITVTVHGVSGARPGMREAAVERALGVPLRIDYLYPSRACGTAGFNIGTIQGYGLFYGSRLASLWFSRGARTGRGVHIGSRAAAVWDAYPKLRSRPDYYVPDARNLFFRRATAPHWRLRFDVSPSGRVTRIAFGTDSVFLVEGCA